MIRRIDIALAAALLVPIAGFAAMVAEREHRLANAPVVNVAIRGVDPRDLIYGRYLRGDLDWEWEGTTPSARDRYGTYGRLCVTHNAGSLPERRKVRFFTTDQVVPEGACLGILDGRLEAGRGANSPSFTPEGLDGGRSGEMRFYVPETQARRLEDMLNRRTGSVSVDLVLRDNGSAAIRQMRVDGVPLGR